MGHSDRLLREAVINLRNTPTEYQDPLCSAFYLISVLPSPGVYNCTRIVLFESLPVQVVDLR